MTSPVSGTVPATLTLELGAVPAFGPFTPGVAKEYETTMTAKVTSSAGDATLSVSDPSTIAPGHLVNGSFWLVQALQARGQSTAFAPVSATPLTLLTLAAPVSNGQVTIGLKQAIEANEPLRTGTYSKTLTFTLSTTTP